jgi:hypothetical protein
MLENAPLARTEKLVDLPECFGSRKRASRQGKADEAEPLLVEGYREMKAREGAMPTRSRYLLGEAAGRLADLAAARGNAADVAKWQAEKNQYPPRQKKSNPSKP